MIDREQMIEAAKTAINKYDKGIQYPAPYPDERDLGRGLMYALEDFIVFEQSSAPTERREPVGTHNHVVVQHRDGKPPWCPTCGLTADGKIPVSRFECATPAEHPEPTEADADSDTAFELGRVAGYDEAMRERPEPPSEWRGRAVAVEAKLARIADIVGFMSYVPVGSAERLIEAERIERILNDKEAD